ncbi:MAG: hypothetical protein C0592_05955 [Marinilabiliales bacterium]|nr:MAG: hypothetical protein C0592_05955 [Marinilabiliales bacterium]
MNAAYKKPFIKIISFFGKKIEKKRFSGTPIYIGGCGRSGTTLLLSIISSHPDIFACPNELGMFNNTYEKDGKIYPARKDRLHRTLLFNKIKKSATRYCEKSPSNIHHINDIDSYHDGDFKFIHIVRDGRDVILSKHPTSPDTYWVNPDRWINDVSAGLKEIDNPKVHTMRYEDLTGNYEETISKICKFLDIELTDEILNWHKHTEVRKNRAYFGEVKPVFKSSVEKWKKPEFKERVEELTGRPEAVKLLKYFKYEI